jgi:hypothetical protein
VSAFGSGRPLPALRVGWENWDPGPPPRSQFLNDPPDHVAGTDLASNHATWRRRVEQDETHIAATHMSQPRWFPLEKRGVHKVVPVLGGTPGTWDAMIAGLVLAARDSRFDRVQVVSLTRWPVLDALRSIARGAKRGGIRFDTISATGSTVDIFPRGDATDVAGFVVDVMRVASDPQGRRDAGREKSDLATVGSILKSQVTIDRLAGAVDVALGSVAAPPAGLLTPIQERELRDYHHTVVAKRPDTSGRLDGLLADLRELSRYQQDSARAPQRYGSNQQQVRTFEVDAAIGTNEHEMGRELLARALARAFARDHGVLELLIVAGAEHLADQTLDTLKGCAQQLGKQLVLFFSEITPAAKRTLGAGGSDFAIFLRLPNADDAEVAAKHFGREFTFVVSGTSIAEGKTDEWSQTVGRSTSSGTTRTHSWGASFGSSVARSLSDETNESSTAGGSTSRTSTTNTSRVHEYVIEPEEFQQLDDMVMLVAEGKRAVLGSCDYHLHRDPLASRQPLVLT